MLDAQDTVFVMIDVQGALAEAMHDKRQLFGNMQKLIHGMQALKVPILWLEQTPEKIGRTLPELRRLLGSDTPLRKDCFSCLLNDAFRNALEATGRRAVVLAGIESHVCVYQTAADLLSRGYTVDVVADAVSSRTPANRQIGLDRMRALGAGITSLEMLLFELLRTAQHPAFKEILRLVK